MEQIYIDKKTYTKLCQYILGTELEISGLGKIERINGNTHITDVKIFEQEVSSTETELDMDSIAKFLIEEDKKGEDTSKYKLWWHSHNTMGAFFSSTDTSTMEELGETFPWLVSIVGNHRQEFKTRVDVFYPIKTHEEVELIILEEKVKGSKTIEKEIKEKVKEKEYKTRGYNDRYTNNYRTEGQETIKEAKNRCIQNGGKAILNNGEFVRCDWSDIENEYEQEHKQGTMYDENYPDYNIAEALTKKEETMIIQRIKYWTKNGEKYKDALLTGGSLCGGYRGCDNYVTCEYCYMIEEQATEIN